MNYFESPENQTPPEIPTPPTPPKEIKPPFIFRQGLFFVFLFTIVIAFVGLFASVLSWQSFALLIIGTTIFIVTLGVFSLKANEQFSEKSTVELIKIVFKQLNFIPQILKIFNKKSI